MQGNLPHIRFTANHNNKLLCDIFPTLRLANTDKYVIGRIYNCYLNKNFMGRVELVAINKINFLKISNEMAYVDCGKPAGYLKTLLTNFYPKANWSTQKLYWCWFKHLDKEKTIEVAIKARERQLGLFANRPTAGAPGLQSKSKA